MISTEPTNIASNSDVGARPSSSLNIDNTPNFMSQHRNLDFQNNYYQFPYFGATHFNYNYNKRKQTYQTKRFNFNNNNNNNFTPFYIPIEVVR